MDTDTPTVRAYTYDSQIRTFSSCFDAQLTMIVLGRCMVSTCKGLEVTSGANFCQIDANGCATDGEGAHGNGEACTVRVAAAGFVTATQFDTESCCDRVTIGGTPYRGLTGPNGVAVAAGSLFTWRSDGSVTRAGWTICWSATPPPPTTAPPSAPAPTSAAPTAAAPTSSNTGPLAVTVGANFCQIDANGCATDGEGAHGNGEACTVRVAAAGFVTATQFDTESGYDWVNISGTRYQGRTGPNGVAVAAGSVFTWRSDGSVTNAGWTICFRKTSAC